MTRLLILALALSMALAAVPAAAQTPPRCTRVVAAHTLLDGRYAAVTCPEGHLTVNLRPGQRVPPRGPARVRSVNGAHSLVAGGVSYRIVNQ